MDSYALSLKGKYIISPNSEYYDYVKLVPSSNKK